MTNSGKKIIVAAGAIALIALFGLVATRTVLAQDPTPTAPAAPSAKSGGWDMMGRGMGFMDGGWTTQFDAVAKALNLMPAQLFEQLHSGKSLSDIATAQGVDLTKIQAALNETRIQAMKDAISQAVKDGKMTQAQADWMLQGLEKGYMPMGRGGFDFDGRGPHGRGMGNPRQAPDQTTTPGSSF